MKFIIFSAILTILISSSFSNKVRCDKEDTCAVCQKTIYELKFNHKAKCVSFSHCKNTCYKVSEEWSRPGSQFETFLKDEVGKCDACFRTGYCSASHCQEQKRAEQKIIESTIDRNQIKGKIIDSKPMSKAVGKILSGEKVAFERLAKKVEKDTKKAFNSKEKGKGEFQKKVNDVLKDVSEIVNLHAEK